MPQQGWDPKAISKAGGPRVTFPPSPSPQLPGTRGAAASSSSSGPHPGAGPGPRGRGCSRRLQTPSPRPAGVGGPGREVRIGSGAKAFITWGRSPAAGDLGREGSPGRSSERGRQEGWQEGRLRVSEAGDAASPAADGEKAPGPPAPPPPASGPATQRHAHGPRRLGISLVARRPAGPAHRPRRPRPLPRACLRRESPPPAPSGCAGSWPPARRGGGGGGAAACFSFLL